jgi:hypothetical protein
MAKFNQDLSQFGSAKPANTGGSQHCAECETMLADALDGTLTAEEQTRFDLHMLGCLTCSKMLADAQRGAAWLELLRSPRPEPSAALLERILAQTTGHTAAAESNSLSILPASLQKNLHAHTEDGLPLHTATILPFRSRVAAKFHLRAIGHTMLQPRLAMTAAMAFFSIGLTLNLTGVQINKLRPSDLKPSSVKRGFYQAYTPVVRYVDNLRAVYELESRVRDLQRDNDDARTSLPDSSNSQPVETPKPAPKEGAPAQKQPRPRPNSGTSRRLEPEAPLALPSYVLANVVVSPPRNPEALIALATSTLQEGEIV